MLIQHVAVWGNVLLDQSVRSQVDGIKLQFCLTILIYDSVCWINVIECQLIPR